MAFLTSLNSISLLKVLPKQMSLIKSFRTHRLSGFNFSPQTPKLSPTHRPFPTTRSRPSTAASANWLHQPNFIIDSPKLCVKKRKYKVIRLEKNAGGQKQDEALSFSNVIYAKDEVQIWGETVPENEGEMKFDFKTHGHVSVRVPCPTNAHKNMCFFVIDGSGSGTFEGVEGQVELEQRDGHTPKMFYKFDLKGNKDLPGEVMEGVLWKKV